MNNKTNAFYLVDTSTPISSLPKPKRKRGFAALSAEQRKEIARLGGLKAQALGTAHQFTQDEARQAGKKGGLSVSQDRKHMAQIGKVGGRARHAE